MSGLSDALEAVRQIFLATRHRAKWIDAAEGVSVSIEFGAKDSVCSRNRTGEFGVTFRYSEDSPLGHRVLKEKQRSIRDDFPQSLTLRVHRALSWYGRAEGETDDWDVRFILLWIGFNAVYAGDVERVIQNQKQRDDFREFFSTLLKLDSTHRIYDAVWDRFPQEIRILLGNRYVFAPFWRHHNGEPGFDNWKEVLEADRNRIKRALAKHDTAKILSILFDRLYVLRNQLVHGGATWNSDVNRSQVKDGTSLIGCLLPVFIDLMMDHPEQEWPMPHYPVVD